jgi:hypothetical protein
MEVAQVLGHVGEGGGGEEQGEEEERGQKREERKDIVGVLTRSGALSGREMEDGRWKMEARKAQGTHQAQKIRGYPFILIDHAPSICLL